MIESQFIHQITIISQLERAFSQYVFTINWFSYQNKAYFTKICYKHSQQALHDSK